MRFPQADESVRALRPFIPRGESLPPQGWVRRHGGILGLLYAHAVALPIFGILMGVDGLHALLEGAIVAATAVVASWPRLSPRTRSIVASFGIMSSSAVLVHLSGGYIEAHFHFFVMLGVIFLYEDWLPYTLSVAYVGLHHGIAGTIDPPSVYNHPAALADPWAWAGVHALFVLGLSAALVVAWGVVDRARREHADALLETRGLRRQLHAQEKLAALGSLAAGLAHEVRTPLTVVSTRATLIEMQAQRSGALAGEQVAAHVREIQTSVERMTALVAQLKRFHRLEDEERSVTSLEPLVDEAVTFYSSANKSGARVRLELGLTPPTPVQPMGIQQVVLNLVSNAVEACDPTSGEVVVRTFEEAGRPCLMVRDNGSGIDDDTRRRLFEPLFTTKPGGTGLGLHIVKRIVDDHGGDVLCDSSPGRGTTFRVRFPAAPAGLARAVDVLAQEERAVDGAPGASA